MAWPCTILMIYLVMNWAHLLILVEHARFLLTCKFCTINNINFVGVFLKITFHSAVFGPKLGTRAMVQSRFSWGCVVKFITRAVTSFRLITYLPIGQVVWCHDSKRLECFLLPRIPHSELYRWRTSARGGLPKFGRYTWDCNHWCYFARGIFLVPLLA